MIKHIVELLINNAKAEQIYNFMINPDTERYSEWWTEKHLQYYIIKEGDENHLGDEVYFNELIGEKRRLKYKAIVIKAVKHNQIIWQMKVANIVLPIFVNLELTDRPFGLELKHEISLGYDNIGKIFNPLIKLFFNKQYKTDLEDHCKIEWFKLADYLNNSTENNNIDMEKEINEFITGALIEIFKYHNLTENIKNISLTIKVVGYNEYGKTIKEIDTNSDFTDDENYRGYGKYLCKDGNSYIILNSDIVKAMISSNYKNCLSIHLILHELGHYINNCLNPELCPPEKPKYGLSLRDCSKYLFLIAIDEYMANNYIIFLIKDDECKELIKGDSLYEDIDNMYVDVKDKYDLFNRFWNSPNSIYKNLISHIPIYKKCGGYIIDEVLELININRIIALLEKDKNEYYKLYEHLVYIYNLIVKEYNSDNPEILQKYIE